MRSLAYRSLLGSGMLIATIATASGFAVYGAIADKWRQLNAERGPLGPALSDEADAPGAASTDLRMGTSTGNRGPARSQFTASSGKNGRNSAESQAMAIQ